MVCPRCGAELNPKQRYCMKCGALNYEHPDNQIDELKNSNNEETILPSRNLSKQMKNIKKQLMDQLEQ